jgi:aminoglycoside phosphotransferase family enzyme/predicted kinase
MAHTDQQDVIDCLSASSTHGGEQVDRIETHASVVFLAGARAWKLKRAVRYDYLDFSTADLRRASCEAEVAINRRTAPRLSPGVTAVTREADGHLALGGSGTPVDWVIEMSRFDQEDLLDRRAASGALELGLMRPLARAIAHLHLTAETRPEHGGRAGMAWVVDGNAADFAAQDGRLVDPGVRDALVAGSQDALSRHAALFDARRDQGLVRQCHGDLHLRNIVLLDGTPTPFDAVEFNDHIACIDVLYDLAFLLMDLWKRGLPRHASAVWNAYLPETADLTGIAALPLFLSCRAAVRAKTSLAAARLQDDRSKQAELQALSREYLVMALRFLTPPGPCLVAIGGHSGSGKSSLAYAVAPSVGPVPGAVVLRSDEIRKSLLGVSTLTRLGQEGYAHDVTRRVYQTLADRAAAAVRAGHGVIVDAVFNRPEDRSAVEQVAVRAGVPFVGLWLDAPEDVLVDRVEQRRHDASDADAAVIRRQRKADTSAVAWSRVDASRDLSHVVLDATTLLGRHARDPGSGVPHDAERR